MVSVIVPIYNVKDYLERCVKSILSQTEKDLQIILVDDGSTDGSGNLCDALQEKDERIEVYHKENGGLSSARNVGIEKARGEFVCFIDSDDIISPYYVEHLLQLLLKNDADIAAGEYITFGKEEPAFSNTESKIEVLEGKKAVGKLFGKSYVNATIACNKLYRKSLFDDVRYPEGKINEDEAVAYKLLYKAKKVVFSGSVIYGYFVRENSITTSRFSVKNLDFLPIAWERCLFFEQQAEEGYYHLSLEAYCWALLKFSNKVKKHLGDAKYGKALLKEFKQRSKILVSSPYVSKKKKTWLRIARAFPPIYFWAKKIAG